MKAYMVQQARQVAQEKCISSGLLGHSVMVWDRTGACRCYSAIHDGFHFSVPSLDGMWINASTVVQLVDDESPEGGSHGI